MTSVAIANIRNEYRWLQNWLFEQALPLWCDAGKDRTGGGFFEKLDEHAFPVREPRRTRVVGRQIFVYATTHEMGWNGPAVEVVGHGLDFLIGKCRREDALFHAVVAPDGEVVRSSFDLYDQAFALFGLASAAGVSGNGAALCELGAATRDAMVAGWAHPEAGFEEAMPRKLPLKSNPHMHMLEACLEWARVATAPQKAQWLRLADQIVNLCLSRFLHPENGSLREYFDGGWRPMPGPEGRIIEPGHQYEWGWLLFRWGQLRSRSDALPAAKRLIGLAEAHGLAANRHLAINELWDDLSPKDDSFRLWPQTERTKAWLAMADMAASAQERDAALMHVLDAIKGIRLFVDAAPKRGLWRERMSADGCFKQEPTPASSLYHLVGAIAEIRRTLLLWE